MFFIDESGSIPKVMDNRYKYRFFVIGFVHTDNPRKLKNTYKRAISKLRKNYPHFFADLPNPKELKGSETPLFMKLFIFQQLFKATDIKIGHMVVCNRKIEERFRKNPARTFNYLTNIIMENFPFSDYDSKHLDLKIDNRNSAIDSLKELEGYLFDELVLDKHLTENVNVEYLLSDQSINIQVADMITNTIYQYFRYEGLGFPDYKDVSRSTNQVYPEGFKYLYDFLKPRICNQFIFPPYQDAFSEVASSKQ